MEPFLALDLVHVLAALVWLSGGAVLALILLTAHRDRSARQRALPEIALIGRRVLQPAAAITLATGLLLAAGPTGVASEAWLILGAALVLLSLAAHPVLLAPALAQAEDSPEAAVRALGLAGLDLAAQAAVVVLIVLRPGWTEAFILAGLAACLALAVALLRSLGDTAQPV